MVFALLVTSCQQFWNKLLTICNNLVDIIRLVTRLFQQVRYSHDIAGFMLQPCVVNLVTFLFIMTVSDLLEQPCDKSDNTITLVTSCQQLVPNLLQQLGTSSAKTTCRQLVNRFVTTCLQTCDNLCVCTYVQDLSCIYAQVTCTILRCRHLKQTRNDDSTIL